LCFELFFIYRTWLAFEEFEHVIENEQRHRAHSNESFVGLVDDVSRENGEFSHVPPFSKDALL
jgi:hypothetical protein